MIFVAGYWLLDLIVLRAGVPAPLDDTWEYGVAARHLLAGGNGAGAFLLDLAIAVPAIAILSALTYRFVEAPALRLKQRRRTRAAAVPATNPAI